MTLPIREQADAAYVDEFAIGKHARAIGGRAAVDLAALWGWSVAFWRGHDGGMA